jgi:predicted outer membrane protein
MSQKLTFSCSFLSVMGMAVVLMAQPVAPRPAPPAKDREPHYKSKPQDEYPRVEKPHRDALGDFATPPEVEEGADDTAPATRTTTKTTTTPRTVTREVRGPKLDTFLAASVALGNLEEIRMAEIALEKAEDLDVRKFASEVAREHQIFLKKLSKFAPGTADPRYLDTVLVSPAPLDVKSTDPAIISRTDPDPITVEKAPVESLSKVTAPIEKGEFKESVELPNRARPARVTTTTTVGGSTVAQIMSLERELTAQCLASQKDLLSQKTGNDFDQYFIEQQLAQNMAMRNKLIVYQRHASPELAAVLAGAQARADQHIKQAINIVKNLDLASKPIQSSNSETGLNSTTQLKD